MQEFILALPVLLFSMVAHEYAHGYAALRQGDPTAQALGRLTLNPLKHIDPFYTLLMPVMVFMFSGGRVIFGGAKPVPVNPRNYRNIKRGDVIVSSAGIVVNLVLFLVCLVVGILVGVLGAVAPGAGAVLGLLQRMLFWGVWLNLLLAFFNLIPVPPLDGSHLLYHLLPAAWAARYRYVARYGVLALIVVILVMPQVFWVLLTPAFALQGIA
ncbi:MAG: site-2 protease family protein, partial [Gemmatimonadales bacterium]|nr:site-2 protease family protein [Gemmatimonadales bacterium]NIN13052.1 site-2 protease family protein [Gemmatimonadales bacterium]NIN51136.1 site-2 protease family protein [Gemmatimonadales bacterium]NIP08600.1 site-2 protease family protein [Gemmatimonadales bacterium]NIQ99710.1 site-2 protease family protein [Gemmatimonadales bacterium]